MATVLRNFVGHGEVSPALTGELRLKPFCVHR